MLASCRQISILLPGEDSISPEKEVEKTQLKRYSSPLPFFPPMQFAWFYKPPEDQEELATLASDFSFFIFTRNDEPEMSKLAEKGAAGEVLQYLRFEAVMDPGDCQTKPFQNQAANLEGDFCQIRDQHPDWFLADINGNLIKNDSSGYIMMNPGSSGWKAFFQERVSGFQKDPVWQGLFLDNVDASLGRFAAQGKLISLYQDDQAFQDAVAAQLAGLSDELHGNLGKKIFANITFLREAEVWFRYLDYLDGAMLEAFAADWNSSNISENEWLTQLEIAETTQSLGKAILLVTQGEANDIDRMRFGLASYLLVNNGKAYFRYTNDEAYRQVWWYPEFDLDFGQPLGPRYQEAGVWRRDFENGIVRVNPVSHHAEIQLN